MIDRVNRTGFSRGPYLTEHIPAVIADGLCEWTEHGKWSLQWLASTVRERRVKVAVSPGNRFGYRPTKDQAEAAEFSQKEMLFTEAMRQITSDRGSGSIYLMQQSLPEQYPELLESISTPPWIENTSATRSNLWFGRNSITPLHYDGQNNFFAQTHGAKEWTIYSPTDSEYLYPYPVASLHPHISYVDPDGPDVERYPDFAKAKPIAFTLQAGELLYLPAFWWHRVRAAGVSVSINFWWPCDSMREYLAAPNAFRNLYRSYSVDRLQSVRRSALAPRGLDFDSAAELLLSHRLTWPAALLALAALDRRLAALCGAAGLSRTAGCYPEDLPGELAALRARLPASSAVLPCTELASTIALQVARGRDDDVDERTVRDLLALTPLIGADAHAVSCGDPAAMEQAQSP